MNIYAINGSPRKKGNTAELLQNALKGAESEGANTELINLYDLNFKGCNSCFECRKIGGENFGTCAKKDGLTGVLQKLDKADAVIFGSPVYFAAVTGEMRSFLERFMFPYMQYSKKEPILFERQVPFGFVYTLNSPQEVLEQYPAAAGVGAQEMFLKFLTGHCEPLYSYDTYQFDDYSKYVSDSLDEPNKARVKQDVFPEDMKKAFDMGSRFAKGDVEYSQESYFSASEE